MKEFIRNQYLQSFGTAKKKTYISDEKYLCGKPKSKSMLLKAVAEIKFLKNDPDCTKQWLAWTMAGEICY